MTGSVSATWMAVLSQHHGNGSPLWISLRSCVSELCEAPVDAVLESVVVFLNPLEPVGSTVEDFGFAVLFGGAILE